jgi:hypothetical protein
MYVHMCLVCMYVCIIVNDILMNHFSFCEAGSINWCFRYVGDTIVDLIKKLNSERQRFLKY